MPFSLLFLLLVMIGAHGRTESRDDGPVRRIHIDYPVQILNGTIGSHFASTVTRDQLTCFGNEDVLEPSWTDSLFCWFPVAESDCHSVWGSRAIKVEANCSVEFFRIHKLPFSTSETSHQFHAQRWFISASSERETLHVPAEPFYLCARNSHWRSDSVGWFSLDFRPVYPRVQDRRNFKLKIIFHAGIVGAFSSVWLLPYLVSMIVSVLSYYHGLQKLMVLMSFSSFMLMMLPFMLIKNNRHTAKLYLSYFFTRSQAKETKGVIKESLPLFQALFFSSVLMLVGTVSSYVVSNYFGIDRDFRNSAIRATIGISTGWLAFFLCRSFERFCRDWIWIALSVGLVHRLHDHLNPMVVNKMLFISFFFTSLLKLILKRVLRCVHFSILARSIPKTNESSTRDELLTKIELDAHQDTSTALPTLLQSKLTLDEGEWKTSGLPNEDALTMVTENVVPLDSAGPQNHKRGDYDEVDDAIFGEEDEDDFGCHNIIRERFALPTGPSNRELNHAVESLFEIDSESSPRSPFIHPFRSQTSANLDPPAIDFSMQMMEEQARQRKVIEALSNELMLLKRKLAGINDLEPLENWKKQKL
jgi:hypothetical protein